MEQNNRLLPRSGCLPSPPSLFLPVYALILHFIAARIVVDILAEYGPEATAPIAVKRQKVIDIF